MHRELRIYTVKSGELDEWTRAWREQILPLRTKLGFVIPGAWTVPKENLFIWLIEYAGADFEAANAEYFASAERRAFVPDPRCHLSSTRRLHLQSV